MYPGPKPPPTRKRPDFKAIANELFDMLYDVLDPDQSRSADELTGITKQAYELLERVECEVKDK